MCHLGAFGERVRRLVLAGGEDIRVHFADALAHDGQVFLPRLPSTSLCKNVLKLAASLQSVTEGITHAFHELLFGDPSGNIYETAFRINPAYRVSTLTPTVDVTL